MQFKHYCEAPHRPLDALAPSIFLAGGITGCPQWQSTVTNKLLSEDASGGVLYNPRRADFPMSDPTAAQAQFDGFRLPKIN